MGSGGCRRNWILRVIPTNPRPCHVLRLRHCATICKAPFNGMGVAVLETGDRRVEYFIFRSYVIIKSVFVFLTYSLTYLTSCHALALLSLFVTLGNGLYSSYVLYLSISPHGPTHPQCNPWHGCLRLAYCLSLERI